MTPGAQGGERVTQVVVHHTPRDVVWHGFKLGFGLTFGVIQAVFWSIMLGKLLLWPFR